MPSSFAKSDRVILKKLGKCCDLQWLRSLNRQTASPANTKQLKIVDVFCGCGGLTLGAFEAARLCGHYIEIALALDFNVEALEVFRRNFRVDETVAIEADVGAVFPGEMGQEPTQTEKELAKRLGHVDILVAGPPCQGHSDLNNHSRRNDPRNELYLKAVRAVEVLRPKMVMIENVATVIHDEQNVTDKSIHALDQMGYRVEPLILDASNLGLAQSRKRYVLAAYPKANRSKRSLRDLLKVLPHQNIVLGDVIGDLEDEYTERTDLFYLPSRVMPNNQERIAFLFENNLYNLPDIMRPPCHREKSHSYLSMYGRLRWDHPAQTITSGFWFHGARPVRAPHKT